MHEWNSRKKPPGRQRNRLLDAVVTITKYKRITIYHYIYIKVLYNGTVSYLNFFTGDVINTTNNETEYPELKRVLKNNFRLKFEKYLSLST